MQQSPVADTLPSRLGCPAKKSIARSILTPHAFLVGTAESLAREYGFPAVADVLKEGAGEQRNGVINTAELALNAAVEATAYGDMVSFRIWGFGWLGFSRGCRGDGLWGRDEFYAEG